MLTFPQASLRSRAAGFPRLGSDLGLALQAFPTTAKLKCWHTYPPPPLVCFAGWSLWWLIPVTQLTDPVTAKCPEPLCPISALPSWGRRLAPSRKALPFLPRSYGLMRQTFTLLPISGYALIRKVFAGCCQPLLRKGSSQRYRCRPSLRAGTPTPAAPRVLSPVSSPGTLAFPERTRVGAWLRSTSATSDGEVFGAAVIPLCSGPQVCSPHR
jgi:hypothetical protein